MKRLFLLRLTALVMVGLQLATTQSADAVEVTPIPGHAEQPASPRYRVTAGGREIEVRAERFGFDVAMFGLPEDGAVVRVELPAGAGAFTLKPERHGIAISRKGDVLEFTLAKPLKLVLQVAGQPPLALIVTPPETAVPKPGDLGVLYFPPGVTTAGVIRPLSNQTVYLAPGALVKGRIEAKNVNHVSVRGRGILETAGYSDRAAKTHGILFENSSDIVVEGIGVRSHRTWWQTLFLNCRNVSVVQVNLFGVGVNTDGVDIDGVRDFAVTDSFIRCEDDGLGWHALDAKANGEPVTERARANNLVIWNTGAGNGIRIGSSMEAQLWRDITIKNVDILMHAGAGICSDFSDWAWCEDLTFRNISIEKPARPIDFSITRTRYSNDNGFLDERGHFDGLVFDHVVTKGGRIALAGFDADHRVDNVYFNGCVNAGVPVKDVGDLTVNPWVTHVRFNQPVPARSRSAPGRYEAERQESRSNQRPQVTYADDGMSNGKGRLLKAVAAGDYVEYELEAPAAGAYRVVVRVKRTPSSGSFQLSVNGAAPSGEQDLFSETADCRSLDLGRVEFKADGAQAFRFTVAGKNAASAGYRLDIDFIELVRL